ncbi:hypothetical protein D3C73_1521150 [compost metagenome]
MVPRKDYKTMAKEIYNLIENPELCKEIGEIERKRVVKYFNWVENVKGMERIYQNISGK